MVEWNTFDYSFEYGFDYGFDYGNRKGPHKQSLIVKCFVTFKTLKIFEF